MHLSWGKSRHEQRLGEEFIESSFAEKDLEDGELDLNWQCDLAARKDNHVLGCIQSSVGSREDQFWDSEGDLTSNLDTIIPPHIQLQQLLLDMFGVSSNDGQYHFDLSQD
ncbi:hypothetical protein TURU_091272 [Turdus rufiventris]|nr:hypothetical protein TURU_091272 [Turdus rufiventris]